MRERIEGKKELLKARTGRLEVRNKVDNGRRGRRYLNRHINTVDGEVNFKRMFKKNPEDYKENISAQKLKKTEKVFIDTQDRNKKFPKFFNNEEENSPKDHSPLTENEIATRAQALKKSISVNRKTRS